MQAAKLTDFEKMIIKKIFDPFDADKNEEITVEKIRTKYIEMRRPQVPGLFITDVCLLYVYDKRANYAQDINV